MSSASQPTSEQQGTKPSSGTYEAGCHCGYVKFAITLSPALPEYKVVNCNCSACTHLGYLLVYPKATAVTWHRNSRERCASYRFNTKAKDQMFCPKCGTSLGIDFGTLFGDHVYGFSVRNIYGVNLDELNYRKVDGMQKVDPPQDLSGHVWDEEKQELR
ncbi:hypothetical protein M426DRAFT_60410 [Hypoxylon sp. CI-4A]|nr:hypothetical protein M426DRAFT_60410 [Hypoxylon sp. CI-4A]